MLLMMEGQAEGEVWRPFFHYVSFIPSPLVIILIYVGMSGPGDVSVDVDRLLTSSALSCPQGPAVAFCQFWIIVGLPVSA